MAKIVLKSDTMNSAPSGAVIAERHRLEPTVAQFGKPTASYTFAGICSILALVVFVAMVVILWLDWDALQMA